MLNDDSKIIKLHKCLNVAVQHVTSFKNGENILKQTYEDKLQKAKEYLGTKWVLHPNYKYDKRHAQFGGMTGKFHTMVIPRTMKEAELL